MQLPLEMPLGSIAWKHPRAVRAFHEAGFDLAVEHGRPLDEACAMRGLDPVAFLARVFAVEAPPAIDWDALRGALDSAWEPLATYLGLPETSGLIRLDEPAAPRETTPRTVSWP
jgi:hypothetical protein